jgi:hypothetical protein
VRLIKDSIKPTVAYQQKVAFVQGAVQQGMIYMNGYRARKAIPKLKPTEINEYKQTPE